MAAPVELLSEYARLDSRETERETAWEVKFKVESKMK